MDKRALTIKEFSVAYGLNPSTVQTYVTRNPDSLPNIIRIGRSVRFLITDVEKWESEKMMK
jgi:predicted DNA-binding transcriptional regulator AlpA